MMLIIVDQLIDIAIVVTMIIITVAQETGIAMTVIMTLT